MSSTEALVFGFQDVDQCLLNSRSCNGKIDSTRSHSGDSGDMPRPPSEGVDVIWECMRRILSALDNSCVLASGFTGKPDIKSECLR